MIILINQVPEQAKYVLNTLGSNSFLVGGCVRDMLMGKQPKDYDITTALIPDEVVGLFPYVLPIGLKHGTVTVMVDDMPIEVTTMRKDGDYPDFRRPESVEFIASLREDLARRDFTINAMAMDINGNIYDYYKGQKDIKGRLIRAVGDPDDRFTEDPLRMMRAIRFASQLRAKYDHATLMSICDNVDLLQNIAIERIRVELDSILLSDYPAMGLEDMEVTGILKVILPEIAIMEGFSQHNKHHSKDLFNHTLEVVKNTPSKLVVRLAALLHDVAKPKTLTIGEDGQGHFYRHHLDGAEMAEEILNRFKYDNKTIQEVVILVREHMSRYDNLRSSNTKRFIKRLDGLSDINDLFDLQVADIKGSRVPHDISGVLKLQEQVKGILEREEPLSVKDLAINGHDLIELGIPQGKFIGAILNSLLDLVMERPNYNNKTILLGLVRSEVYGCE